MFNHGEVTYDGINSIESVDFCDIAGVQPSTGTITFFPQYGLPAENSDLVFTYNANTIVIQQCHADSVKFEAGSGGQVLAMRIVDSRWKWAHRHIRGKYNFRLHNNYIDPNHEKTPQELATLLFEAMGEDVFDVSDLPNDARPEADWDYANASQELDRICNDLGCRIVPVRSVGGWKIVVTGVGNDLPVMDGVEQDVGEGIDPQEVPDYIKIVTGPIRYQMQLPLKGIGKDTDLKWVPLYKLSYAPLGESTSIGKRYSGGFGLVDRKRFVDLQNGNERVQLADGTKVSPCELAMDTVFSCYRIEFESAPTAEKNDKGEWGISIPTVEDKVTRKQIVLSDELVHMWTDERGTPHPRPAYVSGSYYGDLVGGALSNYPDGTRIDRQAPRSGTKEDEPANFSLSLDPLDTDRSIITVNPKLVKQIRTTNLPDNRGTIEWVEADLLFTCAFQIRDPDTWQPFRYEFLMQIGSGTDTTFAATYIKDDIQPIVIAKYESREIRTVTGYSTNYGEVTTQCRYYAESLARKFETVTSQHKTYIGLYPIDMDGAICQVTYSINKGGASTIASQGTEHNPYTPEYEERRQMTARHGVAEKLQFMKYETARRKAYQGSVNT